MKDYQRWVESIEQEMLDRREMQVMARLRALPASEIDISNMRDGLLSVYMGKGLSMREAHLVMVEFFERALELGIFGTHLTLLEDSTT